MVENSKAREAFKMMQVLRGKEASHPWDWAENTFRFALEHDLKLATGEDVNWMNVRLLDLGCGADNSPTDFVPLFCRYIATLSPELVVGIDKDSNDDRISDEYHHLQMRIEPNDEELPDVIRTRLQSIGIQPTFNLITSFGFGEAYSTSPELMKLLKSSSVAVPLDSAHPFHRLFRQRRLLPDSSFWKEDFKTRMISWAFDLLSDNGKLYFGTDHQLYIKQANLFQGYLVTVIGTVQKLETLDFSGLRK